MMTAAPEPAAVGGGAAPPVASRVWEWEGKVASAVPEATADEAWALLSDFLAFHRWHPRVAACRLASGTPRAPGCVRYCEGTTTAGGEPADWAHETLLEHDAERRFFRYEMNDNNMGFGLFFATFRVVPAAVGCELRWEFECEPVRGTPRDALVARLQAGLDGMATRVRDHVLAARAGVGAAGSDAAAAAPAVVAAGLEPAGELVVVKLDSSIAAV
jgi:hypothetical protein